MRIGHDNKAMIIREKKGIGHDNKAMIIMPMIIRQKNGNK